MRAARFWASGLSAEGNTADLSRLGILFNPDVAVNRSRLTSMAEPARVLGLTLVLSKHAG